MCSGRIHVFAAVGVLLPLLGVTHVVDIDLAAASIAPCRLPCVLVEVRAFEMVYFVMEFRAFEMVYFLMQVGAIVV